LIDSHSFTLESEVQNERSAPQDDRLIRLIQITTVPVSLKGFSKGKMRFLQKRGFKVHGISSPGIELEQAAQSEQIAVHAVPMTRRITPFRDLIALWRLYWVIRAIRPHIVHTHTPKGGLLGIIAAWLARAPLRIYTVHGLPLMTARGLKLLLLRVCEMLSCFCAHQVYAVSRSVAETIVQKGLCPATKIKVIHNGSSNGVEAIDQFNPEYYGKKYRQIVREKYKIPADAQVVGFVGRIVRDKGMVELARAWKNLREIFPTLHLLLIGPFEPQDRITREIKTVFRGDSRIHLAGKVEDLPQYYAAMDVCVLPTYREGLPNVLLEAAAMELPVVATQIPGCMDAVVNGVTGILVPPRDALALTEAITTYLYNPDLRRRHGQLGRVRVLSQFRPEALWNAIYEEYLRLLQIKGLPIPGIEQFAEPISNQERRAA
jgi:glycosyltransferase involved in cell wall biosynthesis